MGMNIWEEKFEPYRIMEIWEQEEHKGEIVDLFKDFWLAMPSESIFSNCTQGLVMFPEILYVMATWRTARGRE